MGQLANLAHIYDIHAYPDAALLTETTQIENPRTQWRQEQERMLKEYLVVAQEALNAKKEMYLIKQQRLELAQQEMQLFNQLSQDDNRSVTSCEITHTLSHSYTHTLIRTQPVVLWAF